MADTVRTIVSLQSLLGDGQPAHSTNRQLLRDMLVSIPSMLGVISVAEPRFAGGAVGDGVHDDYPAFQAAMDALPGTGGIIIIPATPTNRWYLSQTLHFVKPIHMIGQISTQSVSVAPTGTVFVFAADQTGIQFEGDTTFGDTLVASRGTSGAYSIVEGVVPLSLGTKTGLANGGTGVLCHGFRVRTNGVAIRDCWSIGFKGDPVRIWGSTLSADPTLKGNCNGWRIDRLNAGLSGGVGINVYGTDANVGKADLITSYYNDLGGILDDSYTGNTWDTCNTFSNGGPSYENGRSYSGSNAAKFRDCYSEYTGEPLAIIRKPGVVNGGVLSGNGAIDTTSTGQIDGGINLWRGHKQHTNKRGTVDISMSLGYDSTAMYFHKYGAAPDLASMDSFGPRWDPATGWVLFDHKGSSSRILWEDPTDVVVAPRVWTRNFRNGLLFGAAGDTGIWQRMGAGVPGAIPLQRGDVSWESLPGINKPTLYRTTVAGSPGTQVPIGVIDVFSADRGDTSVTLVFPTDCRTQRFNTVLTATRSVTLPAGAANLTNVSFRIVREANATGAFNLDVKNSAGTTLVSLTTAKQWVLMLCDGGTFRQVEGGSLI